MTRASEARAVTEEGGKVHFMGIGGAGMSALAEILIDRGHAVSGCDLRESPETARLAELGARIHPGHDPDHLEPGSAVVVSSAIPATNEEVVRARELGLPVVRRAELLGALMASARGIAVAGTHGKSTTTTMVGAVTEAGGLDPTVVVGGRIRGRGGNVRLGSGDWMVAEADEFDRSFLALEPEIAVVCNVEADHLDTYASFDGVREAFAGFLERVEPGGAAILGTDDPEVRRLAPPRRVEVLTFGFDPAADVRAVEVEGHGLETRFTLLRGGEPETRVTLSMPGRHNVQNALAAAAVGWTAGVGTDAIASGLAAVRGVGRRFEVVASGGAVAIVDDYAHHPTEVEATLRGARQAWPDRRIVAVFQPHLFSRTRDFADAFGEALLFADVVFVTDVYPAREEPIEGVSGELVSDAARAAGAADVTFLPDAEDAGAVAHRLEPGDVVVTLGAGDIHRLARRLAGKVGSPDAAVGAAGKGDR
ncbi:MAG: UDP-N-acetylmuramate--L-alanine ligase [Gemmatimonadota bacterium]|nr:UDP-N-acetylmuramate--L-alanine ligase [Gemmatimonadota bacterium]